jgi:hypothetical protein
MALDPKFQLAEASLSELDEVLIVMEVALADDEVWKYTFRDVKHEDVRQWMMKVFSPVYVV